MRASKGRKRTEAGNESHTRRVWSTRIRIEQICFLTDEWSRFQMSSSASNLLCIRQTWRRFSNLFENLPNESHARFTGKTSEAGKKKTDACTSYQEIEKTVKDINSMDKLLSLVVTLVTAAKEPASAQSSPSNLYWAALEDFNWGTLADGTFFWFEPR